MEKILFYLWFNYIIIPYEDEKAKEHEFSWIKHKLDESAVKNAVEKIRLILAAHHEKIQQNEKERKTSEEKVKLGLSKYIDGVFDLLKENEKKK